MGRLVNNAEEIRANVERFADYENGTETEQKFFKRCLRNSRLFVVALVGGKWVLCPAQFSVIDGVTFENYYDLRGEVVGSERDRKLNKDVGLPVEEGMITYPSCKEVFESFEVNPSKSKTKWRYWLLDDPNELVENDPPQPIDNAPELVTSVAQIEANVQTFAALRSGNAEEQKNWRKLLKNGRNYVVYRNDGDYIFAPSRFVGYQGNTLEKHLKLRRRKDVDGKATSAAIMSLFGETWKEGHKRYSSAKELFDKYLQDANVRRPSGLPPPTFWPLTDVSKLAHQLNAAASDYKVGKLQSIRRELGTTGARGQVFGWSSIFLRWAWHNGGRYELQFNIGYEEHGGECRIRHGVAFSFPQGREMDDAGPFLPKVQRFNEYLEENMPLPNGMKMWVWGEERRDMPCLVPIEPDWIENQEFVFCGWEQPLAEVDVDRVLADFDALLPLYRYVMTDVSQGSKGAQDAKAFDFKPGHTSKSSSTTASRTKRKIDIKLRHNALQDELYRQLNDTNSGCVGTELPDGNGNRIDAVLREQDGYCFYEIKTATTAQNCIRQALGQLLEYAHFPEETRATKLIVVGEPVLDPEAEAYIAFLKKTYELPLEYQQITLPD